VSTTPLTNLLVVSFIPANNLRHGFSLIGGVVDNGDKFITGVVDTSEKFIIGVSLITAINSSPVSLTLLKNDHR
jgi:hypothetical protein